MVRHWGRQFVYDAENHQKEVKDSQNNTVGQYLYDGDGKRVKKISATETTVFVYNAGGTLVAEYSTELAETQQVSYLTQDHLGSPRVITNENGAVVSRRDFTAFGEESVTAQRTAGLGYEEPEIRKNYTGYEKDTESGLEFAQARYYNPMHGRFTSVDPLTASASIRDPQTFNRYSYVLNSPYKFTDPLGLMAESPKDKKWEFKCDFNCRVKSGNMTKQDMVLMEWHVSNGSALGYWYLNQAENAARGNQQTRSGPVEVIVWEGNQGSAVSAFGHVSYIIDGISYSWDNLSDDEGNPVWRINDPSDDYIALRRGVSKGVGYTLDFGTITIEEDGVSKIIDLNKVFREALVNAYKDKGGWSIENNCGDAFNRAFGAISTNLGIRYVDARTPAGIRSFIGSRLREFVTSRREITFQRSDWTKDPEKKDKKQ